MLTTIIAPEGVEFPEGPSGTLGGEPAYVVWVWVHNSPGIGNRLRFRCDDEPNLRALCNQIAAFRNGSGWHGPSSWWWPGNIIASFERDLFEWFDARGKHALNAGLLLKREVGLVGASQKELRALARQRVLQDKRPLQPAPRMRYACCGGRGFHEITCEVHHEQVTERAAERRLRGALQPAPRRWLP